MGVKRKRLDGAAITAGGLSEATSGPPTTIYKTGREVRDALQTGSKHALVSFGTQIRVPHSKLPVPINHANVVLAQHYIGLSPGLDEIFKAWKSATERKELDVAVAAVGALTSFLDLLTPLPYFRSTLATIVEKIIGSSDVFPSYLNRLIQSNKREYAQAALGLAAACVRSEKLESGSGSLGQAPSKVWNCLLDGGIVKALPKLLSMRRKGGFGKDVDPLDKADVRHLAIEIILPLLGHPAFLATSRPILRAFWSNIKEDPSRTIIRILSAVWTSMNGQATPALNRKVSVALIDENALESLMKLYIRKDEEEAIDGYTPADLAHHFLMRVCTTPGTGVCFQDESWYRRKGKGKAAEEIDVDHNRDQAHRGRAGTHANDGLHNKILANVLRSIGPKVAEESKYASLVEGILGACPELVAGYWPNSALSVEPRLSSGWISTISFIGRIVSLPVPNESTFYSGAAVKAQPPASQTVIEAVLPSLLGKNHLSRGLQHSSPLVQHLTALALAGALQKFIAVRQLIRQLAVQASSREGISVNDNVDDSWMQLVHDLDLEARKRVPDVAVVIAFAQKSAASQALQASVEEGDVDAKARAELLTEVALRLFGLYHHALPALAMEVRFDVGKLLVSSASSKMEAEARKVMREGSVASDVGSIASVGTVGSVGSIGMGGGFGQSRGDVRGFDGLSQIHVIQLLKDVSTWAWAGKAGGSQYTYLYHLLQLYLETPHQATRNATDALLRQLLSHSILFEHDPAELDVWLASLPWVVSTPSPADIAERLHLLSFLDDCVRRCMKTPHRYMEDVIRLDDTGNAILTAASFPSPLLFAVLEQLQAKMAGHLISAEASLVILRFIRQVVLGLTRKDTMTSYLRTLVAKLVECVEVAQKARGVQQPELAHAAELAKVQLDSVTGEGVTGPKATRPMEELRTRQQLLDAEPQQARQTVLLGVENMRSIIASMSFEWLLTLVGVEPDSTVQGWLSRRLAIAPSSEVPGCAKAILRRLPSSSVASSNFATTLLCECLDRASADATSLRLTKNVVFGNVAIVALAADWESLGDLSALNKIIAHLDPSDGVDRALAQDFIHKIGERVDDTSAGAMEILTLCEPWTAFLEEDIAAQALRRLSKEMMTASPKQVNISKALLRRVTQRAVIRELSPIILRLKLYDAASDVLQKWLPVGMSGKIAGIDSFEQVECSWKSSSPLQEGTLFNEQDINDLVAEADPQGVRLLAAGSRVSQAVASATLVALRKRSNWTPENVISFSPVIQVLDIAGSFDVSFASSLATAAMQPGGKGCHDLVCAVADSSEAGRSELAAALSEASAAVSGPSYGPILALVQRLQKLDSQAFAIVAGSITEAALRWEVSILSDVTELTEDFKATLKATTDLVNDLPQASVNAFVAESVMLAVMQDRLSSIPALDLATVLAGRTELKATTIRQSLQTIMASPVVARSATLPINDSLRTSLAACIKALSIASPYVACQPNFVEPLMALYGGTDSAADLALFAVLKLFETYRKLSVASMFLSWTPRHVTIDPTTRRSLDVLTSLDSSQVFATCTRFDVRRSGSTDKIEAGDGTLYDVVFVLSLTAMVMAEGGLTGLDWVEVLRSNVLGLAICALSSRRHEVRNTAGYILAKAMAAIEVTPFQERPAVMRALRVIRHSIPAATTPASPRLPSITTLFFAHTLRSIADPSSFLYPLTSRFLLQRPTLDGKDVPMLYGMLYAAGQGGKKERRWMVRFLRESARGRDDWHILRRRHTFALLATLYESTNDPGLRKLILQAISSFVDIPVAACHLVDREGLLPWLAIQVRTIREGNDELAGIVDVIEKTAVRLCQREDGGDADKSQGKRRWVAQMENVTSDAAQRAPLPELCKLSRSLFGMAVAPGVQISMSVLRSVTLRLRAIEAVEDIANDDWRGTVELLLRTGFAVDPTTVGEDEAVEAVETMRWLCCRAVLFGGEVREYVREEWKASR